MSGQCEDFIGRQFDRLAELAGRLKEWQAALEQAEAAVSQQRADLDWRRERVEALRQTAEQGAWRVQQEADRLAAARTELETAKAELKRLVAAGGSRSAHGSPQPAPDAQLQLERELAEAQARLSGVAGLAAQLSDARRRCDRLQAQLIRQSQRLAHAKGHFDAQRNERLRELEAERDRLNWELAATRERLVEQTARADEERDARNHERSALAGEFKRLRTTLESLASQPGGSTPAVAVRSGGNLDEVLACLQTLQHELDREAAAPDSLAAWPPTDEQPP
jgi:chromosome segregation ATPase